MAGGSRAITWTVNTNGFKDLVEKLGRDVKAASRPTAQAGAQVLYEWVKAKAPVSKKPHFFYGRAAIQAPRGQKHLYRYGLDGMGGKIPFPPGNLKASVYQVFSKDKSKPERGLSTFHVSWNQKKAPYGFAYEYGEITKGAIPFVRSAVAVFPEAAEAMRDKLIQILLERDARFS